MAFSTKEVRQLGFSISHFIRLTGLSRDTLKKMDRKDPSVREDCWARAERGLATLKAELQTPVHTHRTVAG